MIKNYYILTKPGIVYGNIMAMVAGFALAAQGLFDIGLFLASLAGLALIIASACVFNNYIDRSVDTKMNRTKGRPLVTKVISQRDALVFASVLGIIGTLILAIYTNFLTVFIALLGFFFYVVVYGIAKRKTLYGTHIGTISGAVPPVVGYCAVTNTVDTAAVLLFLILVFWQMPHFLAIAIFRRNDYAAAAIPVMSIKQGIEVTKINMTVYAAGFILVSALLTFLGYTGYTFLITTILLGGYWLWINLQGFKAQDDNVWARKNFKFSIIVLMVLSFLLAFEIILP